MGDFEIDNFKKDVTSKMGNVLNESIRKAGEFEMEQFKNGSLRKWQVSKWSHLTKWVTSKSSHFEKESLRIRCDPFSK